MSGQESQEIQPDDELSDQTSAGQHIKDLLSRLTLESEEIHLVQAQQVLPEQAIQTAQLEPTKSPDKCSLSATRARRAQLRSQMDSRETMPQLVPLPVHCKGNLKSSQEISQRIIASKQMESSAGSEHPIENCCPSASCSSSWENMSGTDQFRICSRCQCHVYDFTKMSLDEAQRLVYQREGIESRFFYRRADGRFLTNDCPVGASRRLKLLAVVAGSVALLGALMILTLPTLSQHKPTRTQATSDTPGSYQSQTTTVPNIPEHSAGAPGKSGGGLQLMGAGQRASSGQMVSDITQTPYNYTQQPSTYSYPVQAEYPTFWPGEIQSSQGQFLSPDNMQNLQSKSYAQFAPGTVPAATMPPMAATSATVAPTERSQVQAPLGQSKPAEQPTQPTPTTQPVEALPEPKASERVHNYKW